MNRLLALILLACALALPALPVHADATGDLFEAAKGGTASEVKAALAAGADIGARNIYGATPFGVATVHNSNPSAITALIEAGADARDGLYGAAFNSNPSVISALIEAGADPNARGAAFSMTPLHFAAQHNSNPFVTTALIEDGADPGARDKHGYTPLHKAAMYDNPSVIAALIEAGVDPDARTKIGNTPLHKAAEIKANRFAVAALIEGDADPGARDKDGKVPFDYAENAALFDPGFSRTDAYRLLKENRFE